MDLKREVNRSAGQLAKVYNPGQCLGVHPCDIPVLRIDSDPMTIEPIGELSAIGHDEDLIQATLLAGALAALGSVSEQ